MKIFVAVLAIALFVSCTFAAVLPELIDDELQHEMGEYFVKINFLFNYNKNWRFSLIKELINSEEKIKRFRLKKWILHKFFENRFSSIDTVQENLGESRQSQDPSVLMVHSRQRRFTCDAFSFSSAWVTPNHTACALKCVGKGRKGGHCEKNRCVCRDDRYIGWGETNDKLKKFHCHACAAFIKIN